METLPSSSSRPEPFCSPLRRAICLQYALLGLVAIMSSAALVLLVLGACAISSRPDPSDPVGVVGTLVGGALLLITCSVLLVVVCVWSGRCFAPPTPLPSPAFPHHDTPNIRLDAIPPPPATECREMRYLTPVICRGGGGGGGYAPLAQHEELTPSLHSSFQSMDDL